jgi:hypothetical protein
MKQTCGFSKWLLLAYKAALSNTDIEKIIKDLKDRKIFFYSHWK